LVIDGKSIDRENAIANLEQNIRWIEDHEQHQFPGWGNVVVAMRDAVELLKEQKDTIPIQTVAEYLAQYAAPPVRSPLAVYGGLVKEWERFFEGLKKREKQDD